MRKQAFNPYLPLNVYIPDGEPHVFSGRIYIFGSHDKEAGDTFCMEPYEVWSAPVSDLSDWSCPGISYEASQDPSYDTEIRNALYAPDVVKGNDGKFYLYYCLSGYRGKGGYANPIGVAVSETPDGRYEYLGVVRNPDGTPFLKYINFDPALINDSGVIRLYSGTWYPMAELDEETRKTYDIDQKESKMSGKSVEHIHTLQSQGDSIYGPIHVTLADDMMTITSEPVRILPLIRTGTPFETSSEGKGHGFFEGSSIRKIKDKYYFIYSSCDNHELCYAVSDFPDRDFVYGGTIVSNGDIGLFGRRPEERLNITGTTHGSIECIQGQWYVFYHRLTHKSDYSRQGCAEKITIDENGRIQQAEITSCGLNDGPLKGTGSYPAVICCNLTNGKMPHTSNARKTVCIPYIGSENNERFIRDISDGTLIGYKYFSLKDLQKVTLTVRGNGTGVFAVSDEINGTVLGQGVVTPSDQWNEITIPVSPLSGIRPLYITYHGEGLLNLLTLSLD